MSASSLETVAVDNVVAEYLQFQGFSSTLQSFIADVSNKGRPAPNFGPQATEKKLQDVKAEVLRAFDSGDYHQFFELWATWVPAAFASNAEALKVEFHVRLYFAVYPAHPNFSEQKSKQSLETAMANFRAFLDARGSELTDPVYASYFGLPFFKDPAQHPTFKELFQVSWPADVRTRLETFLVEAIRARLQEQAKVPPKILELAGKGSISRRGSESVGSPDEMRLSNPKDLVSITADLYAILEKVMADKKMPHPDALKDVGARIRKGRYFSVREPSSQPISKEGPSQHSRSSRALTTRRDGPVSLDYAKVKGDLVSANVHATKKALLLQALRWRLEKAPAGLARQMVLTSYVTADLLGSRSKGKELRALLTDRNSSVREYAARLVNSFSSEYIGRTYLVDPNFLPVLCQALHAESDDSVTRQNLLATLQKLSLRRRAQEYMIENDVIQWIVSLLGDPDSISSYTLDYASALLMNLSLRASGKQRCAEPGCEVLQTLNDLLEIDNPSVLTYVHGTLYSVFSVPSIREEALAMGMEDIITYRMESCAPELQAQLNFILQKLRSDDDAPLDDDSEDSDDDEAMSVEPSDDEESLTQAQTKGSPSGEILLEADYQASEMDAQEEEERVRQSMDIQSAQQAARGRPTKADGPTSQPMTPRQNVPASKPPVFNHKTTVPPPYNQPGNTSSSTYPSDDDMDKKLTEIEAFVSKPKVSNEPSPFSTVKDPFATKARVLSTPEMGQQREPLPLPKASPRLGAPSAPLSSTRGPPEGLSGTLRKR